MKRILLSVFILCMTLSAHAQKDQKQTQSMDKMWGRESVQEDALKAGKGKLSPTAISASSSTGGSIRILAASGKVKPITALASGSSTNAFPAFPINLYLSPVGKSTTN